MSAHAACASAEFEFGAADAWGHFAPAFHLVDAFGIFCATAVHAPHVTLRAWDARAALCAIDSHGVTVTNVASTMLALVLAQRARAAEAGGNAERCAAVGGELRALRLLSCGGSGLALSLIHI